MKFISFLSIMLCAALFASCGGKADDGADTTAPTSIIEMPNQHKTDNTSDDVPKNGLQNPAVLPDSTYTDANGAYVNGFVFSYNGVNIILGEPIERVLGELGPALDSYEYAACAFEGDARMYLYGGFEIATYMRDGADVDRVYSVTFNDDSVMTAEGVYIGLNFASAEAAYGSEYEEIPGCYIYTLAGTHLSFNVDGSVITTITYEVADVFL